MDKKEYPKVIKELEDFKKLIIEYEEEVKDINGKIQTFGGDLDEEPQKLSLQAIKLREKINQKIPIIKSYFEEADVSHYMFYTDPLAVGGRKHTVSLIEDIFNLSVYTPITFQDIIDRINQCIGVYAYLVESKKSIIDLKITPIFDIINLIEKNLRKSFKKPPQNEIEVQDHIETILNARDIKFSRDKVSFEYSSKSYKPDFVVEDLETIVEVKFCNSKGDESKIIAEINDDIVAYKTKYKILIFIVYDTGIIRDEDRFKEDIADNHNVYVRVIKH